MHFSLNGENETAFIDSDLLKCPLRQITGRLYFI